MRIALAPFPVMFGLPGSRSLNVVVGHSNLIKAIMFQVLGTDELNAYLNKYHLELDPQLDALVGRYLFQMIIFY